MIPALWVLLILIFSFWVLLYRGAGRWGEGYELEQRDHDRTPTVSVCIPARNERGRIGACVAATLASDYPHVEVLVIDDGSDDGTAEEAEERGGDRIRILSPEPRPETWAGKAWACQQGADATAGELLLFIDADVRLAPWTIGAAVSELEGRSLGMLSLFGGWELKSFWEKVLVPVIGWFIRGAVDLALVNAVGGETAFANGQFILIRRSVYNDIGGHGAVRTSVLDDVSLARTVKAAHHPIGLRVAPNGFSVRLYASLAEIVAGYSKNLYEGMDRRPGVAIAAMVFVTITTLAPWVGLLWASASPETHTLGAAFAVICTLMVAFRFRLERRDGRSGLYALTHPLGNCVFLFVLLRSMLARESHWKGRRFVDGQAH